MAHHLGRRYDISDYQDVDPPYGTLRDAEELIDGCHKRGMRVLFERVFGSKHCSGRS